MPTPVHNLRGNAAERSPRHFAVLDTETRWEETPNGQRHSLRLWCLRLVHRGHDHPRLGVDQRAYGFDVESLCDRIEQWLRHSPSLWLYMHNTTFDLGVTRLPMVLARRGFQLGDHALTMPRPWCRLNRKRRTLTIVDSASVFPKSVEHLGVRLGTPKPTLPGNDDSDAAWLARCEADVDIVAAALRQAMDWWDEHRLGCWSLTGPASGWNAYRHQRRGQPIVIDPNPRALAFERRTVTGGRRDAFRIGRLPRARYVEIDFERAHLTICRTMPLPRKRSRAFVGRPRESDWLDADRWGMIAEVTVRADTPRYPVHISGRQWYPTGTMRTVLAGPMLREAHERGDLVDVHRGWCYWLEPHMQSWADWLCRVLDTPPAEQLPAVDVMCKAWSRSVPGKWATRTSRQIEEMPSLIDGWAVERGIHHPSEQPFTALHIDGTQTWWLGDQEGDDSFPAVLAWIQAHTRMRLNALVDALPADHVVSCNTDGVIVKAHRTPDLDRLARLTWPLVPRVKAVYHDVTVIGPNHLLLDGEQRLSGVPASAPLVDEMTWGWHTWPSLRRQLELAPDGGYVRQRRTVDLSAVPVTRWVLRDGRTVPVETRTNSVGGTEIVPWGEFHHPLMHEAIRRPQHPVLEAALAKTALHNALPAAVEAAS